MAVPVSQDLDRIGSAAPTHGGHATVVISLREMVIGRNTHRGSLETSPLQVDNQQRAASNEATSAHDAGHAQFFPVPACLRFTGLQLSFGARHGDPDSWKKARIDATFSSAVLVANLQRNSE